MRDDDDEPMDDDQGWWTPPDDPVEMLKAIGWWGSGNEYWDELRRGRGGIPDEEHPLRLAIVTDDPAKMIDDYDDIDDADDIDADTPEGARLHKEARSRKGGVFVDTNGDDAWLHEEILEAADGRRQKKLRIRPTPMNEDWLRTMSWNFPRNITAEQFERLFASRTLEEFMRLPAARPMPAKLRADVMRRIEQRAEQPPPDKTDGPSDPRELVS